MWEHHQVSCALPCCVFPGQNGSWRTEKGEARDCQESDCSHPNEDLGFPRHSERKRLDEKGMGGSHHAIVMEQAREVDQYPLVSFFLQGSFWSLTASLGWIYAISEGCVLCANECAFPLSRLHWHLDWGLTDVNLFSRVDQFLKGFLKPWSQGPGLELW